MAKHHCRTCRGEFASLSAFDAHVFPQPDSNAPLRRPVCVGERNGEPFIDPALDSLRDRMAAMREKGTNQPAHKG